MLSGQDHKQQEVIKLGKHKMTSEMTGGPEGLQASQVTV